jgi:hypothetical protein
VKLYCEVCCEIIRFSFPKSVKREQLIIELFKGFGLWSIS